jgi:hypothetical protein
VASTLTLRVARDMVATHVAVMFVFVLVLGAVEGVEAWAGVGGLQSVASGVAGALRDATPLLVTLGAVLTVARWTTTGRIEALQASGVDPRRMWWGGLAAGLVVVPVGVLGAEWFGPSSAWSYGNGVWLVQGGAYQVADQLVSPVAPSEAGLPLAGPNASMSVLVASKASVARSAWIASRFTLVLCAVIASPAAALLALRGVQAGAAAVLGAASLVVCILSLREGVSLGIAPAGLIVAPPMVLGASLIWLVK